MRSNYFMIVAVLIGLLMVFAPSTNAGLGDLFNKTKDTMGGSVGIVKVGKALSEDDIINGLKEALRIGTENAVEMGSKLDGFYKNPVIKIPLPNAVQKVETLLRAIGYGPKVNAFVESMNHAA